MPLRNRANEAAFRERATPEEQAHAVRERADLKRAHERGGRGREPNGRNDRERPKFQNYLRQVSQVIAMPNVAALAAATGSVATTSAVQQVEFNLGPGYIVGMALDAKNDGTHLGRSSLGIKLEVVGSQSALTTDSRFATFIPLSLLCSDAGTGVDVCPLVRRVGMNDRINVTWQNQNTTLPLQPCGSFLFVQDCDLPPGIEPCPVGTMLPGATRFILTPNQYDPGATLAAGFIGRDSFVEFQQDGTLLGFRADAIADAGTGRASLACLIEDPESHEAFTGDGKSSAYVQLPTMLAGPDQMLRLSVRRKTYQKARVSFLNTGAVTARAPVGCLFFRGDEDVRAPRLSGG